MPSWNRQDFPGASRAGTSCFPGGQTILGDGVSLGCLPSALNSGVALPPHSERAKTWQLDHDEEEKEDNYEGRSDIY